MRVGVRRAILDFEEANGRFADDRFAVDAARLERRVDLRRGVVKTAIRPNANLERVAGCENGTVSDDRATRTVDDFRRNLVTLVVVREKLLRKRRVDNDLRFAVGVELRRSVENDLRNAARAREPSRNRSAPTPSRPTGVPRGVAVEPTVTGPVKPIPRQNRVPSFVVSRSRNLIRDFAFGNGRAEKIFRGNRRFDLVAERNRLGRRVDGDLKLRFAILFETERPAAVPEAVVRRANLNAVNAESSVFREFERTGERAEIVQNDRFRFHLVAARGRNRVLNFFTGPKMRFRQVVFRRPEPKLEFGLLTGAIKRAVGDEIGAGLRFNFIVRNVCGAAQLRVEALRRKVSETRRFAGIRGRDDRKDRVITPSVVIFDVEPGDLLDDEGTVFVRFDLFGASGSRSAVPVAVPARFDDEKLGFDVRERGAGCRVGDVKVFAVGG